MVEQMTLNHLVQGSSPWSVTRKQSSMKAVFVFTYWNSLRLSLDIVPFLRIIKSTGEPIKAPIEESRLVEAVRDVQRKR